MTSWCRLPLRVASKEGLFLNELTKGHTPPITKQVDHLETWSRYSCPRSRDERCTHTLWRYSATDSRSVSAHLELVFIKKQRHIPGALGNLQPNPLLRFSFGLTATLVLPLLDSVL